MGCLSGAQQIWLAVAFLVTLLCGMALGDRIARGPDDPSD
jgi:hypothetical protein